MSFQAGAFALIFCVLTATSEGAREEPKTVEKITQLPVALSNDFEFRKTKLFYLSERGPTPGTGRSDNELA